MSKALFIRSRLVSGVITLKNFLDLFIYNNMYVYIYISTFIQLHLMSDVLLLLMKQHHAAT